MDNSYSLHRPCARMERWRRVVTLQYAYHSDAEPLKSDCFIQIGVFDCKVHKQTPHVKVGLFRMVTNRTSPRLLVWESGRCGLWRSLRVPGHGQWLWGSGFTRRRVRRVRLPWRPGPFRILPCRPRRCARTRADRCRRG